MDFEDRQNTGSVLTSCNSRTHPRYHLLNINWTTHLFWSLLPERQWSSVLIYNSDHPHLIWYSYTAHYSAHFHFHQGLLTTPLLHSRFVSCRDQLALRAWRSRQGFVTHASEPTALKDLVLTITLCSPLLLVWQPLKSFSWTSKGLLRNPIEPARTPAI